MASNRNRTPNWTHDEKNVLINILHEHIDEIESKRNDYLSNQEKSKAWTAVLEEFHARRGGGRDLKNIKEQWKRIKLFAKKEWREASLAKTSGGRVTVSSLTSIIQSMLPVEFIHISNQYDDYAVVSQHSHDDMSAEGFALEMAHSPPAVTVTRIDDNDEGEEDIVQRDIDDQSSITNAVPFIINRPLTSISRPSKVKQSLSQPWSSSKKQRTSSPYPQTAPPPSSMEDILKEHADLQHNLKMQHLEEEHAKRMEILELEKQFHKKRLDLLNVVNH